MEIHVDSADDSLLKDDVMLSVRFGGVRRQVQLSKAAQTPLSFPEMLNRHDPRNVKFDVLSKVGSGWLMFRPGEERYKVPLLGCGGAKSMTVRIAPSQAKDAAVLGHSEAPAGGETWDGGTPSTRPGTADCGTPTPRQAAAARRSGGAGGVSPLLRTGLELGECEPGKADEADDPDGDAAKPSRRRDRAQSAKDYLERHQVITFIHALLHAVLKERPADPYAFMASQMPKADPAAVEKGQFDEEISLKAGPPPPTGEPPPLPTPGSPAGPPPKPTPAVLAVSFSEARAEPVESEASTLVVPETLCQDPGEALESTAPRRSGRPPSIADMRLQGREGEKNDLLLTCAMLKLQVRDLERENHMLVEALEQASEVRTGSKGAQVEVADDAAKPSAISRCLSPVRVVRRPALGRSASSRRSNSPTSGLMRRPTLMKEQFSGIAGMLSASDEDVPVPQDALSTRARTEPMAWTASRQGIRSAPAEGAPAYASQNLQMFWKRLRGESDAADEYRVLRQSVLTGRWTLYSAGGKAKKPHQYSHTRRTPHLLEVPRCEGRCPFCVGNEHKTPPPLLFFDKDGEMHQGADLDQGWLCRVIPNIFPLLVTPAGLYGEVFRNKLAEIPHSSVARGEHANEALFATPQDPHDKDDIEATTHRQVDALGYSEVVIENPAHNGLLAIVDAKQAALALWALQSRGRVLSSQAAVRQLLYFKQYGANSGGSLVHPHMQIVTLPLLTPETQTRLERAVDFYHRFGKCSVCHCYVEEPLREDGHACSRLVHQSKHFMVVVPFAANQYRVTIVPKEHHHSWLSISREEVEELAEVLQLVMESLFHSLDDPEYNVYFFSIDKQEEALDAEAVHWVLEVHPRFPAELGGVELASGIRVISGLPEDWAQDFKATIQERLAVRRRRSKRTSTATNLPDPAPAELTQDV
mmetsp:Transcript_79583/g.251490  ORF Transcript_79583/g.251490 Transcript_79583/m.251490 type:complete len:925 (+) Transcript_79583:97-2871(+)